MSVLNKFIQFLTDQILDITKLNLDDLKADSDFNNVIQYELEELSINSDDYDFSKLIEDCNVRFNQLKNLYTNTSTLKIENISTDDNILYIDIIKQNNIMITIDDTEILTNIFNIESDKYQITDIGPIYDGDIILDTNLKDNVIKDNTKINDQEFKLLFDNLDNINDNIINDITDKILSNNFSKNEILKTKNNNIIIIIDNIYAIKIRSTYLNKNTLENFNEHLHEAFVGLYGTNKLKSKIPNFSYIYGIKFSEDCPTDSKLSSNNHKCDYIFYEYIEGISFDDFIKTCTSYEYDQILKQILLALYVANKEIEFVHSDLHVKNIIIQILKEPININYGGIIINTKYLAKFIDYGLSHINYNNKDYGCIMIEGNVYNKNIPLHDIFKILMMTYNNIYVDTDKLKILNKYLKPLINVDIKSVFYNYLESNPYFSIRYDQKYEDFSFVEYLKNVFIIV